MKSEKMRNSGMSEEQIQAILNKRKNKRILSYLTFSDEYTIIRIIKMKLVDSGDENVNQLR